jgi:predicted MPP superfamily phosphohydrolase
MFLLFNLALAYVVFTRPQLAGAPGWFIYAGAYPFYIWFSATFLIGLGLLIAMLVKAPFTIPLWIAKHIPASRRKIDAINARPSFQQFDASRRVFLRRGMYGLTAASFAGSAYGMLVETNDVEINDAEFHIPRLPPELDGFTIALASDIHSSVYMTKEDMVGYAQRINGMKTDMIAVVGDFVNGPIHEVYPFAEAFSTLHAPHGVYGVMGNHDFYNPDPDLVAKEVDDCGITLLRNDTITIEKNGATFYLIGVDDIGRANSATVKLDAALGSAPLKIPRILLCHRPYYLQEASEKNIDLMLSGHTHGGQVVLGQFGNLVIAPASLASRYIWGKYRIGNTQMYVSRGIGTVGLPIRLNCPPELTRITLRTVTPTA